MRDARALKRLQGAYGHYLDQGMRNQAADLFAPQGTIKIGGQGVFVDDSRVFEYVVRLSPDGPTRGRLFNHIQLQSLLDVAPDGFV